MEPAPRRVTYAEYTVLAEQSDVRLEYIGGEVVAMAGGTIEHGRLIAQASLLLGIALRGRRCVVMPADVRVRIRAADRGTYPDLHVVCSEVQRDPDDALSIVNPTVVVEVLSDSTAATDRGSKFDDYRRLASLREYVTVSQRERLVEVWKREGRRWHLDGYAAGERLTLASIEVSLAVDEIYVDELGVIVAVNA